MRHRPATAKTITAALLLALAPPFAGVSGCSGCSGPPPTEKGAVLDDQSTNAWKDPDLGELPAILPDTQTQVQGLAVCAGDADLRITTHTAVVPTQDGPAHVLPRVVVSVERQVADWSITADVGGRVVGVQDEGDPIVHAVPLSVTCSRSGGAETRGTLVTLRADGTIEE